MSSFVPRAFARRITFLLSSKKKLLNVAGDLRRPCILGQLVSWENLRYLSDFFSCSEFLYEIRVSYLGTENCQITWR